MSRGSMNPIFLQRLIETFAQSSSSCILYKTSIQIARTYGLYELIRVLEALKSEQGTPPAVIHEVENVVNLIKTMQDLDWKDRLFYLAYFRDLKANAKVFTADDTRVLYVLENAYDIITRGAELPEKPPRTILDNVQELRELNHLKTLMRYVGKEGIDKRLINLRSDRAHPNTTLDVDQQRTLYVLELNYQDITGEPFPQLEFREPVVENNHETNQTAKAFLKQIPQHRTYYGTSWTDRVDNTKLYIPQLMFYGMNMRIDYDRVFTSWKFDTFFYNEETYDSCLVEDQVHSQVDSLLNYMRPKDAMEYLNTEECLETYTPSHFKNPQHAAATLLSDLIWVMVLDCEFDYLGREIEPAPLENYEW